MGGGPFDSGRGGDERPDGESYRTSLGDGESVSDAVVRSAAALTGRSPVDLDPLFDAVDPDALDAMIRHDPADDADPHLAVTFSYESCTFEVTRDELVVRVDD